MKDQPIEKYKPAHKLELKKVKKELPKKVSKIICPSCEEGLMADNINLQNSVAKCSSCNVIFSIEEEVDLVKTKKDVKQEYIRPEGIDLFYYQGDLDITVQQHIQGLDIYGITILPLIAFFSILIYFIGEQGISPYIPIVSSLAALYFIYRGLNYSNNKTYIEIYDNALRIKYRPRNFKKDKVYAADEIDQLYIKHSSDGMGHFTIHMIINGVEGQKHKKLLTVNTLSKAKYLEQEIERYLEIENREVPEATI